MFIDGTHLFRFRFETPDFARIVTQEYHRHEVYLRRAVT